MPTIHERWQRSLELRRTWKRTSRDGVPCRVAFTLAELRKAQTHRNSFGVITGVTFKGQKRTSVKDVKGALANLLAYVDGAHGDASAITRARELVA